MVLQDRPGLQVAVANGDCISSPSCADNLLVSIGGKAFSMDFYGLALGSYDIVLSVQWFQSLGPILWDFARCTMAFVRNGARVLWTAAASPALPPGINTAALDLMEDLLAAFQSLFVEPLGLPLARSRCHRIQLMPGAGAITVRPYRYAHAQKDELERQCALMLQQGIIRPSSSAFSASVLLVRKQDESWRLCAQYQRRKKKALALLDKSE